MNHNIMQVDGVVDITFRPASIDHPQDILELDQFTLCLTPEDMKLLIARLTERLGAAREYTVQFCVTLYGEATDASQEAIKARMEKA